MPAETVGYLEAFPFCVTRKIRFCLTAFLTKSHIHRGPEECWVAMVPQPLQICYQTGIAYEVLVLGLEKAKLVFNIIKVFENGRRMVAV
jgi:hypothetical protein